jgi:hypothetical protein
MMHGHEKSDSAIVAVKLANKVVRPAAERSVTGQAAAELVEPRAGTKGNADQQSTRRTQNRASVTQALERMRQAIAVVTRGRSRMRESCTYGSVRGASSNGGPYRDRRTFIRLLGGAAATWQMASARAQQPELRRIGVLMSFGESDPEAQARVAAFREGLQKLGWTEGRNIRIDTRWATANVEWIQRFAKELLALQPDLVLSADTPTTAALLQQTRSVPIIFAVVSDPVGSRFVASYARPDGNVTGFTNFEPTIASKWLELLKELAPRVERVAFLFNPGTAPYAEYFLNSFKAAAASFGMETTPRPSSPPLLARRLTRRIAV